MARPDRIRNSQLFWLIWEIPFCAFVRKTIPQAITRTTAVRIAVARLELTPSMPTFARIDVSAANTDDRIASKSHMMISLPYCQLSAGAASSGIFGKYYRYPQPVFSGPSAPDTYRA